jgi:hypothetical protein
MIKSSKRFHISIAVCFLWIFSGCHLGGSIHQDSLGESVEAQEKLLPDGFPAIDTFSEFHPDHGGGRNFKSPNRFFDWDCLCVRKGCSDREQGVDRSWLLCFHLERETKFLLLRIKRGM